jgi:hypothetical protein
MELVNILGRSVPKVPTDFIEFLSRFGTGVHWHHISDYSSNVLASVQVPDWPGGCL